MSDEDQRLSGLLEELQSAIARLSQISVKDERSAFDFGATRGLSPAKRSRRLGAPDYASLASQLYKERRKRDQLVGLPGVFGEPAWDMLLDLTIAYERGQHLSVTAVTAGSAAPSTTALRYLSVLEKRGILERVPDKHDGRRSWVQLTYTGSQMMRRYLDCVAGYVDNGHSPIEVAATISPKANL